MGFILNVVISKYEKQDVMFRIQKILGLYVMIRLLKDKGKKKILKVLGEN